MINDSNSIHLKNINEWSMKYKKISSSYLHSHQRRYYAHYYPRLSSLHPSIVSFFPLVVDALLVRFLTILLVASTLLLALKHVPPIFPVPPFVAFAYPLKNTPYVLASHCILEILQCMIVCRRCYIQTRMKQVLYTWSLGVAEKNTK